MESPLPHPDGYTQWDRLPIAYPRLHEGVRGGGSVDCQLRCVARIERYELAARTAGAGEAGSAARPATARVLAGLADDYRARCAAWSDCEKERTRWSAGQSLLIVACGLVGPLSLWAVVSSDARLASLRWWPAALMAAPLALPLTFTALAAVARAARPRVTLGQSVRERRCPDCAATLAGVPPAIAPAQVDGVDLGPLACARCRRPWPLLPPPADAIVISDTRTGRIRTLHP